MKKHEEQAVSHTNRRGVTYFLHCATTKKGGTRYVMKKASEGAMSAIPEGMEIVEDPNGLVSVRRVQPQLIASEEVQLIEAAIGELGLRGYRVAASGDSITVYEPATSEAALREIGEELFTPQDSLLEKLARMAGADPGLASEFAKFHDKTAPKAIESMVTERLDRSRVEPVMRFVLSDATRRTFSVDRMTYRGDGGWWNLSAAMDLKFAAKKYLKHLGEESFFELM